MIEKIQILYRLSRDSEYESIICEDAELNLLYDNSTKYYKLPFSNTDYIKIRPCKPIGEFSLYLLSEICNNAFENTVLNDINLLKQYLLKCINDENYCDKKVFLAFITDFLHIPALPRFDCFVTNYYTDDDNIIDSRNDEKLDMILKNASNITINKDYLCDGIIELIVTSIYEIFSKGLKIKKCKSCDRFFVNKNSSAFCNYANPQNETLTCLQYSRNTTYVEKRKEDPVQKTHSSITNLLRKRYYDARDSKNHDKELEQKTWQIYEDYKEYYNKTLKPQYTKGEITKEDFIQSLENKYKYYKNNNIKYGGLKDNGNTRNNKK